MTLQADSEVERLRALHDWELAIVCDWASCLARRLHEVALVGETYENVLRLQEAARRLRRYGCDHEESKTNEEAESKREQFAQDAIMVASMKLSEVERSEALAADGRR